MNNYEKAIAIGGAAVSLAGAAEAGVLRYDNYDKGCLVGTQIQGSTASGKFNGKNATLETATAALIGECSVNSDGTIRIGGSIVGQTATATVESLGSAKQDVIGGSAYVGYHKNFQNGAGSWDVRGGGTVNQNGAVSGFGEVSVNGRVATISSGMELWGAGTGTVDTSGNGAVRGSLAVVGNLDVSHSTQIAAGAVVESKFGNGQQQTMVGPAVQIKHVSKDGWVVGAEVKHGWNIDSKGTNGIESETNGSLFLGKIFSSTPSETKPSN